MGSALAPQLLAPSSLLSRTTTRPGAEPPRRPGEEARAIHTVPPVAPLGSNTTPPDACRAFPRTAKLAHGFAPFPLLLRLRQPAAPR